MDGNEDTLSRVLAGETRAIARLMSRVEGRPQDVAELMAEVHKHAGRAHVIGLTGVPGSGKSTLVHAMAKAFVLRGAPLVSSPLTRPAHIPAALSLATASG